MPAGVKLHEGGLRDRGYERELLYSEVVEHLRAITSAVGISQHVLAERLGVSDARISRILTSRENLTLRTLADIGWALGLRFEVVAVPVGERWKTPAKNDPTPPAWLENHAALLARRVQEAIEQAAAWSDADPDDTQVTEQTI